MRRSVVVVLSLFAFLLSLQLLAAAGDLLNDPHVRAAYLGL